MLVPYPRTTYYIDPDRTSREPGQGNVTPSRPQVGWGRLPGAGVGGRLARRFEKVRGLQYNLYGNYLVLVKVVVSFI